MSIRQELSVPQSMLDRGRKLQNYKSLIQIQKQRPVLFKDGATEDHRAVGSPDSDSPVHAASYLMC